MERAHFDDSGYPVLLIRMQGDPDESDARALQAFIYPHLQRALQEDQRIVLVVDSRDVGRPAPEFRRSSAEWEAQLDAALFERLAARVVILESAIVRGALTAISWISPRARGVVPVATVDAAIEALRKQPSLSLDERELEALRDRCEALRIAATTSPVAR